MWSGEIDRRDCCLKIPVGKHIAAECEILLPLLERKRIFLHDETPIRGVFSILEAIFRVILEPVFVEIDILGRNHHPALWQLDGGVVLGLAEGTQIGIVGRLFLLYTGSQLSAHRRQMRRNLVVPLVILLARVVVGKLEGLVNLLHVGNLRIRNFSRVTLTSRNALQSLFPLRLRNSAEGCTVEYSDVSIDGLHDVSREKPLAG